MEYTFLPSPWILDLARAKFAEFMRYWRPVRDPRTELWLCALSHQWPVNLKVITWEAQMDPASFLLQQYLAIMCLQSLARVLFPLFWFVSSPFATLDLCNKLFLWYDNLRTDSLFASRSIAENTFSLLYYNTYTDECKSDGSVESYSNRVGIHDETKTHHRRLTITFLHVHCYPYLGRSRSLLPLYHWDTNRRDHE